MITTLKVSSDCAIFIKTISNNAYIKKKLIHRFALLTSLQMYNFVHINKSKISSTLSVICPVFSCCFTYVKKILENRTPQCLC